MTAINVSVLLNNGDGTFAAQVTYGVGDSPYSVASGDLDGDGDLDGRRQLWSRHRLGIVQQVTLQIYYGAFPRADDEKDYFYFDLSTARSVELWLTKIPSSSDYDLVLRDTSLN